MVGVVWPRTESQSFIPSACFVVLGMGEQRTDTSDVGGRRRSSQGIFEKHFAQTTTLPDPIYRKAGEEHDGNRVAAQTSTYASRRLVVLYRTRCEAVIGDHNMFPAYDIGSGTASLLICQRKTLQKMVKRFLATIEAADLVDRTKTFHRR